MKKTIRFTLLTALSVFSILLCILLCGCNTIKAVGLSYPENEDVDVALVYFQLYKSSEISGATFITQNSCLR